MAKLSGDGLKLSIVPYSLVEGMITILTRAMLDVQHIIVIIKGGGWHSILIVGAICTLHTFMGKKIHVEKFHDPKEDYT